METLRGDFTLPYLTLYCKKGNTDGDTEEGGGGGTSHHPTLHCTVRREILMETLRGGLHTTLPYIVL